MSINDSILNSVGLTNKNIKFLISDNGDLNEWVTLNHDQHQVLRYCTTLMTAPEHCSQCGFLLSGHFYLVGTDTASYKLPTANGYQQILLLTKQRYQCLRCKNTFIPQSKDFMPDSTISRPLVHQIIDLARRDIPEKDIADILHL
ncbi:hypothetical protein [Weissella sagaensis]|uniref:hypothetical protein n=1 Tax=Weissella sagaensis TaxID=2559928 RepID=UPI00214C9A30|nr:hypothetical protein [Weissella sagaensis]